MKLHKFLEGIQEDVERIWREGTGRRKRNKLKETQSLSIAFPCVITLVWLERWMRRQDPRRKLCVRCYQRWDCPQDIRRKGVWRLAVVCQYGQNGTCAHQCCVLSPGLTVFSEHDTSAHQCCMLSPGLTVFSEHDTSAHHSVVCCLQDWLCLVKMILVHITVLCAVSRTDCV